MTCNNCGNCKKETNSNTCHSSTTNLDQSKNKKTILYKIQEKRLETNHTSTHKSTPLQKQ